jgi:quercetin dioxygenase-like cupin family protein
VAQSGSALGWGPSGRWFESSRPDFLTDETFVTRGSFDELPVDEPWPGVHRRAFDAAGATVTHYDFDPGASFPLHSHPQEQITLVQEGEVEFTVGGEPQHLGAGEWSVVPPGVEHGLRAASSGARFLAIIVPRRGGATVNGEELS